MSLGAAIERLVEAFGDVAVCALDADGRIVSANAAAARLANQDAAALAGMPYASLWGRVRAGEDPALAAAAASGMHETLNWRVLADGRRVHLRRILVAAKADATPTGYLLIVHPQPPDALPGGLAPRVAADKLDALARMAGSIAHEFNNVTQVLNTAVEILSLKLGRADAEITRYIDMLRRGTERATAASQRLLAFAGGQLLTPTAADANDLVLRCVATLRQALPAGIEFDTSLDPDAGVVFVDPAAFQSALRLLADNASDAMGGRGRIRLSTSVITPEQEGRACVAVAMRDEGTGMTEEVKARVGEPYFTTKSLGRVRGHGLAQVYGFLRQSGGRLAIDSAPGAGTTVRLLLPRLEVPGGTGSGSEATGEAPSLSGVRVLVVEDEMLVAMLVEDLLTQLGCEVVGIASSLDDALQRAKTESFDLALLDVNLQSEAVYPVAKLLAARGVPFVFMSGGGHVEPGWSDRPVIQKPFQLEQVRRRLHQVLGARRG